MSEDWGDAERAQWVLENGCPKVEYYYCYDGDRYFKYISTLSECIPPWAKLGLREMTAQDMENHKSRLYLRVDRGGCVNVHHFMATKGDIHK